MTSSRLWLLVLFIVTMAGCGGGGGGDTAAKLVSLSVSPTSPSIAVGTTQQFTAVGTYSDGTVRDLTGSVAWTSTTGSIPVSATGVASGSVAGTSTITATSGTVSASTPLTVTTATLASLSVTPEALTIGSGTTVQYKATGTFSDSSTQDITSSVVWSSTNTSAATISNAAGSQGRATTITAGTTTIKAISGVISATTNLTVTAAIAQTSDNVLRITVNGSLCDGSTSSNYPNKPCVSVTVCAPGTSNCQTINDVLLDTGSYGLRVFKTALNGINLPQVTVGSKSLAECVQFGDLSTIWGPVQYADVKLGNEPTASNIPIHVIDASFGNIPSTSRCYKSADAAPTDAGYTAILGVGHLVQDCGDLCVKNPINYYGCSGSSCTGSTVPLAKQVINPVAALPLDNNGVLVQLPSIPLGGTASVNGSLILGIGTRSNNTPSGVKTYSTDAYGTFQTTYAGSKSDSFLDTGSNGIFFDSKGTVAACAYPDSSWYCPPTTLQLQATNIAFSDFPSGDIFFNIGNFYNLAHPNNVFSELGGTFNIGGFDWGLPFYFGRNVFVGFNGKTSTLGPGPFSAY